MKRSDIVHVCTIIITLLGGLLAYADKIQSLDMVPAGLAQYWPLVIAGASALRAIVRVVADFLDDYELNDSVKLLGCFIGVVTVLALSGCAGSPVDRDFRAKVKAVSVDGAIEYDPTTRQTRGSASARFELRDPSKDL